MAVTSPMPNGWFCCHVCLRRGGRSRNWALRDIVTGTFHFLSGDSIWSLLGKMSELWSGTYYWLNRFSGGGIREHINHQFLMLKRERVGSWAGPTANVIDCHSVNTIGSGGTRGYDASRKINGHKRYSMVDTDGFTLRSQVDSADIQDHGWAGPLLQASSPSWLFVTFRYADRSYTSLGAVNASPIRIEMVRKSDNQVGFAVIAHRFVIEQFLAWTNHNRRLANNFEATIESVNAFSLSCLQHQLITEVRSFMNRVEMDSYGCLRAKCLNRSKIGPSGHSTIDVLVV